MSSVLGSDFSVASGVTNLSQQLEYYYEEPGYDPATGLPYPPGGNPAGPVGFQPAQIPTPTGALVSLDPHNDDPALKGKGMFLVPYQPELPIYNPFLPNRVQLTNPPEGLNAVGEGLYPNRNVLGDMIIAKTFDGKMCWESPRIGVPAEPEGGFIPNPDFDFPNFTNIVPDFIGAIQWNFNNQRNGNNNFMFGAQGDAEDPNAPNPVLVLNGGGIILATDTNVPNAPAVALVAGDGTGSGGSDLGLEIGLPIGFMDTGGQPPSAPSTSSPPLYMLARQETSTDLDWYEVWSGSTKTFVIPHPTAEGKMLRHSCIEAPTRGTNLYEYQVSVETDDATTEIALPEYFAPLNGRHRVYANAVDAFSHAYGKVNDEGTKVVLRTEKAGTYNVLVTGVRKDPGAVGYSESENIDDPINPEDVPESQTVIAAGDKASHTLRLSTCLMSKK